MLKHFPTHLGRSHLLPSLMVLVLVVLSCLPAFGSQLRAERTAVRSNNYFPLKPGFKWLYAVRSAYGAGGTQNRFVEVLETVSTEPNRSDLRVKGYFGGDHVHTVRTTPLGIISEIGPDGSEYLWYRMDAAVEERWTMRWAPPASGCENGVTLIMGSRTEKVSVPAGDFSDVLRIDRGALQCADAGIVTEWFAPGVGLIKRTETTFAGPLEIVLVSAQLGDMEWPSSGYTTALQLNTSTFVNNLMPMVNGSSELPVVNGSFSVRTRNPILPTELVFSGCKSLLIDIRNSKGELVRSVSTNDGGCCACDFLLRVNVDKEMVLLPFSFTLADENGKYLPDGLYSLTAVLQTQDPDTHRPAARARIEVQSVH